MEKSKNNRNVILIYPPSYFQTFFATKSGMSDIPLSLLYLSGAIRHLCEEILILDYNTPPPPGINTDKSKYLYALLDEKEPVIVGINCLFSGNFPDVLRISKEVKERSPATKVVIGGMHPTLWAKEIMEHCEVIDAIMLGEGDNSFPLLVEQYFKNPDNPDIEALESVVIRWNSRIITKERKRYITNLDSLPMPGYEYFDMRQYAAREDTTKWFNPNKVPISAVQFPLLTSRSCPNQCNFCAMRLVMGDIYRYRSPEHVFNEIQYLYEKYGITYFKIMDDNFTINKKRTIEICNLIIKNNLKIAFDTPNGLMAGTLDDEVIDNLCRAGMIRFSIAIESASDFIRNDILHKNISKEKIHNIIYILRKHNVFVSTLFMIGFPEETEETLKEMLSFIKSLDVDAITLAKLMPFPGTALYEQCKKDNLFTNSVDEDNLWQGKQEFVYAGPKDFSIKPYNLTMNKLADYDEEIRSLITKKNERWANHVRVMSYQSTVIANKKEK
ncbi:B12-binding domain-containing radical SAM protein [Spirochaetia bacterium]|nr:B12-binding domain-containing radical SAM protein [Spirochaetia bacterium]